MPPGFWQKQICNANLHILGKSECRRLERCQMSDINCVLKIRGSSMDKEVRGVNQFSDYFSLQMALYFSVIFKLLLEFSLSVPPDSAVPCNPITLDHILMPSVVPNGERTSCICHALQEGIKPMKSSRNCKFLTFSSFSHKLTVIAWKGRINVWEYRVKGCGVHLLSKQWRVAAGLLAPEYDEAFKSISSWRNLNYWRLHILHTQLAHLQ